MSIFKRKITLVLAILALNLGLVAETAYALSVSCHAVPGGKGVVCTG